MKRKLVAVLLTAGLLAGLASCGNANKAGSTVSFDTPFVSAISSLNGVFNPFFATTAYDVSIADMALGNGLVTMDRVGDIVYNAIAGETRAYNGVDYNYRGLADVSVSRDDAADTTSYRFKLREGVRFSDGQEMDADDVIFSIYVFLDPAYEGNATLGSIGLLGYNAYLTGVPDDIYARYQTIADAILAVGPGHPGAGTGYTAQQYTDFQALYNRTWRNYGQKIVDYVLANYSGYTDQLYPGVDLSDANFQVAYGMAGWGFGEPDGDGFTSASGKTWNMTSSFPTIDDYYNEFVEAYGTLEAFSAVELAADTDDPVNDARNAYISQYGALDPAAGELIDYVAGIKKIDQYTVEFTISGYNAAAIYRLGFQPAPLHYYGSEALYNYDQHKFGFPKGDLSLIASKTDAPMGAGPYKFLRYENKVVYYEANPLYWRGAPKIKFYQYKETNEPDSITAVTTGTVDTSEPSNSKAKLAEIAGYNSNGQPTGDVLSYIAVDNLGYGYIGINPERVKVGNEAGSTASKNLRKAIGTILAVYRDLTIDTYYGDTASTIDYPISKTSWAAPRPTDPGYTVAYSKDVEGRDIYSASMGSEQRYAAAEQAALGYFQAAGYTVSNGRVTAAPQGASLSYSIMIAGSGVGDHPSFMLLTSAQEALARLGIILNIQDLAQSTVLFTNMNGGTVDMWVAAWSATVDPDLYQTYHSSNVIGKGTGSNVYNIADLELDRYIEEARRSLDNVYRKEILQAGFRIIMDWGVEIPVYQRQNANIYSSQRFNMESIGGEVTTFFNYYLEELELTASYEARSQASE
ncbi:MAG: ABC transporter substrate-binding protein [Treponema sp.]|jgi:peptide/nickel transport system substrate-binding protein|nr:ABC transporter substrate-binding protein [Treponema sp.]